MQTRVAIVKAGHWGNLRQSKGDYDFVVQELEASLKEAASSDGKPCAEVRVVESTEEALAWLYSRGIIVYISRGMTDEAKKVAAEHRYIRAILFTGVIPDGEVVFLRKSWISSDKKRNQELVLDA